jgi:hypothetical protein
MSFAKLFKQSNSSLYSLRGNVIDCSIELTRGNIIYLETGLKSATACFQSELKRGDYGPPFFEPTLAPTKQNLLKDTKIPEKTTHKISAGALLSRSSTGDRRSALPQKSSLGPKAKRPLGAPLRPYQSLGPRAQGQKKQKDTIDTTYSYKLYNVAIEDLEVFGEPKLLLPKSLQTIRKRKLVWSELSKVWCSSQNRIRGFILNSVKGGYAVAIAGHIAFLPKSLLIKSYGQSKFRFFSILNMNPSFQNIVVKELPSTSGQITKASAAGLRRATSVLRAVRLRAEGKRPIGSKAQATVRERRTT